MESHRSPLVERPARCMQGAKEAIPCIFQFPAHTTIMSKGNEVAPLLTPCAMLFWPNSSRVHFLCYHKQHCNRGRGKRSFNLRR